MALNVANTEVQAELLGLSGNTTYALYVGAQDAAGNNVVRSRAPSPPCHAL